jgi:hypothetical protein
LPYVNVTLRDEQESTMAFPRAVLTALILSTAAAALAESPIALRDLSVEQVTASSAGTPRPGSLSVTSWLDRSDGVYAVGERFRLFVRANEDAHITIVTVGPSGRVTQLFPNAYHQDNRVPANQTIEIPPAASGAVITVAPPAGTELIRIIASSHPIPVFTPDQLQQSGMFATATGGVPALVHNLEATAANPAAADVRIALENLLVRTVLSRAASR